MADYSSWYDINMPPVLLEDDQEVELEPGFAYAVEPFAKPETQTHKGKDVLVVDDDPYLCDIMVEVLESEGHNTRSASNGQEALDRIRERKPQLVLLDLMMPVMNGWEVASALRANPDWADIPVVLITAAHGSPEQKRASTGARAVISKPFDIDTLAEVVDEHAND